MTAAADRTPLARRIAAAIAADGPMPLSAFMAACLTDPEHGYYTTRSALGASGDFTTAPEVSQIFGELIGLWAAQVWADQGGRAETTLAELGPGRGVLMADALRAIDRAQPTARSALQPTLVEISPRLRAEQAQRLDGQGAIWADGPDQLPDAPLLLVANEFFDALPVDAWRWIDGAWRPARVGLDGGRLAPQFGPPSPPPAALAARFPTPPEGAWLETRPDDAAVLSAVGGRIVSRGGAALILDYGYDDAARQAAGGRATFQALQDKRPADPFDRPGEADLTAHVNFDDLAAAAPPGLEVWGPVAQGRFLLALGAEARAARLMAAAPDQAAATAAGFRRLTDGAEMGQLFKVLALTPAGAPAPPGFEGARARRTGP